MDKGGCSIKSSFNEEITVSALIFLQGEVNENREYSSTTTSKYLLADFEGLGPTKSIEILSNG